MHDYKNSLSIFSGTINEKSQRWEKRREMEQRSANVFLRKDIVGKKVKVAKIVWGLQNLQLGYITFFHSWLLNTQGNRKGRSGISTFYQMKSETGRKQ